MAGQRGRHGRSKLRPRRKNPHWKAFVAHARATSRCVRIADDSGEEIFSKSSSKDEKRWILELWPSKFLLAGGAKVSRISSATAASASSSDQLSTSAIDSAPKKRRSSAAKEASTVGETNGISHSLQPGVQDSNHQSPAPAKPGDTIGGTIAIATETGSDLDKIQRENKRVEGQSRRGQKRPAEQSQTSVLSAGNKTMQPTKQPSSQSHACAPLLSTAGRKEESAEQALVEKRIRPKAAKSLEVETAMADIGHLNQVSSTEHGAGGDHGKSSKASDSSRHLKANSRQEQKMLPKVAARQPLTPDQATGTVKSKVAKDKNSHDMAHSSLHGVGNTSLPNAAAVAAAGGIKIPRKTDGRHQPSMADSAAKIEISGLRSTVDVQHTRGDNCGDQGNSSLQRDSYGKRCREKHSSKDGDGGRHMPSERTPADHPRKQNEQRNTCTAASSGQVCGKGVTEAAATRRRDSESWSGVVKQEKQLKEQPLHTKLSTALGAVSDRTTRPETKETVTGPGARSGELRRESLPDPSAVTASAKQDKSEVSTLESTEKDSLAVGKGSDPDASPASAPPAGWTRHWSKTWSAHYIFNPKTGEQRWESGGPQGVMNGGSRPGFQTKKPN